MRLHEVEGSDLRGDDRQGAGAPARTIVVANSPVPEELREGMGVVVKEMRLLEADDEALLLERVEVGVDVVATSHTILRGGVLRERVEVVGDEIDIGDEADGGGVKRGGGLRKRASPPVSIGVQGAAV